MTIIERIVRDLLLLAVILGAGWWVVTHGIPEAARSAVATHDQAAADHAAVGTQAAALAAAAVAAGQANTACLRSSSTGYRAGMTAARAIDNPPPAPPGVHPSVDAAGFKKLIGGGP